MFRTTYTFDDVLLVPKHGVLDSRKNADISSELVSGLKLKVPIVSANMPSVTEHHMAAAMHRAGGFGILHRFCDIDYQVEEYKYATGIPGYRCGASFGIKNDDIKRINKLYDAGCRVFCLDVAHADNNRVIETIYFFKNYREDAKLIVGNIATTEAAWRLAEAGVDAIKIGIGPGAACRTREVTGFGVPQFSAIYNITSFPDGISEEPGYLKREFPHLKLIADGGIKNSGDIVKALAAGADTVMIGSLLAGCDEAPNPGEYYGNASHKVNGHRAPEGSYGAVEKKGSVEDVIKELAWGIRSGLSYGGARNIKELQENAEFILCSAAGQKESQVRLQNGIHYEEFYMDQVAGTIGRIPL